MTYFDDVGEFHKKFELPYFGDDGAPCRLTDADVTEFRRKFMQEELDEFTSAYEAGDLHDAADALADLIFVALGTAHFLRIPFDAVWREVQRANMTKVRAAGADDPLSKRRHRFDVVKPANFIPPNHRPALEAASASGETKSAMRGPVWWDRWFLGMAEYASTASKDPSTVVGALVVAADDRRKVAWGYNGFPPGIADTPKRMADRATKYQLINHAEENALVNATFDVRGGTLYCTCHPCVRCARAVISRRIARVVTGPLPVIEMGRWTEEIPMAQEMMREAGVVVDVINLETET